MRAFIPAFNLSEPKSYKDLLEKIQKNPGYFKLFAGGTDLMVLFESGKLKHQNFINILNLRELQGISQNRNEIIIGSCTNFGEIKRNALIQKFYPNLAKASHLIGADAIQNRATLGGNIINASPAADSPPALLNYRAKLILESKKGIEEIEYKDFHLDYKKTMIKENQVLKEIRIPIPNAKNKMFHFYHKVGTRKFQAISKVCFSGLLEINRTGEILNSSIALGSVAPKPILCLKTSSVLVNTKRKKLDLKELCRFFIDEIAPVSDIRSTKEFRTQVSLNLLEEFVRVGLGL